MFQHFHGYEEFVFSVLFFSHRRTQVNLPFERASEYCTVLYCTVLYCTVLYCTQRVKFNSRTPVYLFFKVVSTHLRWIIRS